MPKSETEPKGTESRRKGRNWETTSALVRYLITPRPDSKGNLTRPALREAADRILGLKPKTHKAPPPHPKVSPYITAPSSSRYRAVDRLRAFIKILEMPEAHRPDDASEAQALMQEIQAAYDDPTITWEKLYSIFDITPYKPRPASDFSRYSGSNHSLESIVTLPALPQPEIDPARREIDIVSFIDNLVKPAEISYIGDRTTAVHPAYAQISDIPLNNRGF